MIKPVTPTPLCTAPLYWITDDSIEFVGSSTLIEFRGSAFLVTCGHCTRFRESQNQSLLVGGSSPFTISRPILATINQNSPYSLIDLAIIRLTETEKENLSRRFQFVSEVDIEHSSASVQSDDFAVVGYPAEEGRSNTFLRERSSISFNVSALPAVFDHNFRQRSIDANPSWHLKLGFKPFLPYLREELGLKMRKLNGFSGGPILRCSEVGTWSLAGVSVQTYHRRAKLTLVGVSAKALIDVIRHWWDALEKNSEHDVQLIS
jgi:hypothetical protein